MRNVVFVAAVLILLGVPALALSASQDAGANLVNNPSFEQASPGKIMPDGWSGSPQVYSLDRSAGRTGTTALKFVNDQPQRYCLCSQKVPVQPGWKCRFSVWVKTRDVVGEDSGATICMQWSDKQGKWLGGSHPSGVKGTHDWTRVAAVARVPEEAGSVSVTCYVRKGMTGTAWFDDVEVVRIVDPPMQSMVLSPNYRGRITAEGSKEARIGVRLNLTDYDYRPESLLVSMVLRAETGGNIIWQSTSAWHSRGARSSASTFPATLSDQGSFAVPVDTLLPGKYDLAVTLEGPTGKHLQTEHHTLVRTPDDFRPKVSIDHRRRLTVDGKPFFPLGMYWSSISEKNLQVYSQSKFNCIMPYGSPSREQMDLAQKYGIKVIYSIKDWYAGTHYCPKSIKSAADEEPQVRARVQAFRDHPALLAWYLNDELSQKYLPQLEAHQRWVAEEDPHHPTWAVLYQYREVSAYRNTFDVIGTDPYPIGRKPASMAAEWTAETFRQVDRSRPLWQVAQLHNWANYAKNEAERKGGRTPTYDEMRSMAWQCIAEGATGLVFYCWHDIHRNPDVSFETQWEGLKRIAAEIDQMAPILLDEEGVGDEDRELDDMLTRARGKVRAVSPRLASDGSRAAWLHWFARRHGGKCYLFMVNDGDGQGRVSFWPNSAVRLVRRLASDQPLDKGRAGFEDDIPRLAVQIYEFELQR